MATYKALLDVCSHITLPYRPLHIYAAWCGAVRFLLHTEQTDFLYLAHLDNFPSSFRYIDKMFLTRVKVNRIVKIIKNVIKKVIPHRTFLHPPTLTCI